MNKALVDKKGFTLAETLITLVIIGVVAALTIPTMLNSKFEEKAIKSSLLKNYSVLKQVVNRYYIENGVMLYGTNFNTQTLQPILLKYVNNIYDCGRASNNGISELCVTREQFTKTYKNYNGSTYLEQWKFDDGEFLLADGSLVFMEQNGGHVYFSVDVNGVKKKPNQLGRDLFMFQVTSNGQLVPMGAKNTAYYNASDLYCSDTSTDAMNGAGCTYKYLQNK